MNKIVSLIFTGIYCLLVSCNKDNSTALQQPKLSEIISTQSGDSTGITMFFYDNKNKLIETFDTTNNPPGSTSKTYFHYDNSGKLIGYNVFNSPNSIESNNSSFGFIYNNQNQIIQKIDSINNMSIVETYSYNEKGRLTDDYFYHYVYDDSDDISKVEAAGTIISTLSYNSTINPYYPNLGLIAYYVTGWGGDFSSNMLLSKYNLFYKNDIPN